MPIASVGQITITDTTDSLSATLSNESAVVPSNPDGSSPNLSGCSTTVSMLLGGVDDTANWAVAVTPSSGVAGTLAGRTYTVESLTTDAGWVDFTLTRTGWATATKRFNVSKGKQGATGAAGAAGSNGLNFSEAKLLFSDPTFQVGSNGVSVYNNLANGTVTHTRIAKLADSPFADSGFNIEIANTGVADPDMGGFFHALQTRANAVFIQRFVAKVPVGYTLATATNAMGTGSNVKWLTSNAGTGQFQEYLVEWRCGHSGTFSSTVFIYLAGTAGTPSVPVKWWLAYETVYDFTALGFSTVVGLLSNDSHTVPTDSAGNNGNFTGAATTLTIFNGTTDDSANWAVTAAATNVTGSLAGRTYTVTAMSADTGFVDLTATRGGFSNVVKRFTLSKSKGGVTGATGATGAQGPQGVQGPAVVVTPDRATTFTSTDGTLDGSQADIVFTAAVSGVTSPTYAWTFSGLQTNPTASTTATQTVTAAQFGTSKAAIVTCTVSGAYTDKVTIVRLERSTAAAGATAGPVLNFDQTCSNPAIWPQSLIATITGGVTGSTAIVGSGGEHIPESRTFPFDTTRRYRVSALIRKTAGVTTGSVYLGILNYDAAGTVQHGWGGYTAWSMPAASLSTNFTRYSVVIAANSQNVGTVRAAAHIILGYPNTGGGRVEFQGVKVEDITDAHDASLTSTWGGVSGAGKPADNATKNTTTYASTAPASPTDGDIWVDTSVTPNVTRLRVAGAWQVAANNTTNTNQLTDGAGLGTTATWAGVSGAGKPLDNAGNVLDTRNANTAPSGYGTGNHREFKLCSVVGITTSATYCVVETIKGWGDSSGGEATQWAYVTSGEVWKRSAGAGATSWGTWVRDLDLSLYTGALNATNNVVGSGTLAARPTGTDGDFYYATDTGAMYQKVSGAWVLSSTNTSIDASGNIQGVSSGAGQSVANNVDNVIRSPGGGVFVTTTDTLTGALKIKLPQLWSSTMMKFTVEIFEYIAGFSCTLEIAGYNFSSGGWYNCTARVIGGSNVEYPVRFGRDADKCCVWIGNSNETWMYPQVRVRDFFGGYSNASASQWSTGWAISFDTTALTAAGSNLTANQFNVHITDTLPGADWSKLTGANRPDDRATVGPLFSAFN